MPGIEINQSNTGRVREMFRQYTQYNRRETDALAIDQSRKLATDLYNATADIAPTRAEIAADVKALGWKIPAFFGDGRMGRGTAKNWLGLAFARQQGRIRKRGRKSKKDHQDEATFMAAKPTLAQMQAFVIKLRDKARLYLASGWLGAIVDLGGSTKSTSGFVDRNRGGATIFRSPGLLQVIFWNRTPGILTMQDKKDFVGKAMAARVADMWIYVRKKQAQGLAYLKRAA